MALIRKVRICPECDQIFNTTNGKPLTRFEMLAIATNIRYGLSVVAEMPCGKCDVNYKASDWIRRRKNA